MSAPTADAIAVFAGSTRKAIINGTSGQFSVAPGATYTIQAVAGPSTSDGWGSTSVSPVAPPTDVTAPVTTSDAKATYVSSATIKLTATDAGSGVATTYYRLDGGAQMTGTSVTTSVLGAHTLQFWSVDAAGNTELFKSAAFSVNTPPDVTAPVTTSDAKATYVSSATIKLTATDAGTGVASTYYKLDGGAQTAGTSVTTSAIGAHTLVFWSVDVAGNAEVQKTASFSITSPVVVDVTAPVTTSDAKATYVSTASIKLTATDAGSGVASTYYKLDGGAQTAGTTIACNTLGAHSIEFWSVDGAGNSETHKTAAFSVNAPPDVTAPVTTSDAKATYVSSASIKLTATDAGSGVASTYYKLDGGAQTAGTTIACSTLGAHSIEFWSVDKSNNAETHKTAAFSISAPVVVDATAPVTTSDAKATYVTSATIKLTATDAGSGVKTTLFRLDGGAETAGTVDLDVGPGRPLGPVLVGRRLRQRRGSQDRGASRSRRPTRFPSTSSRRCRSRRAPAGFASRRSVTLSGVLNPGGGSKPIAVYVKQPKSKSWKLVTVRATSAVDASGASTWAYQLQVLQEGHLLLPRNLRGRRWHESRSVSHDQGRGALAEPRTRQFAREGVACGALLACAEPRAATLAEKHALPARPSARA